MKYNTKIAPLPVMDEGRHSYRSVRKLLYVLLQTMIPDE